MRRFRAVYDLADPIGFGSLSFEALDLSAALRFLASLYCRKPLELWCDGRFFGRFQRIVERNAAYWRVLDHAAAWPRRVGGMLCPRGAGEETASEEPDRADTAAPSRPPRAVSPRRERGG